MFKRKTHGSSCDRRMAEYQQNIDYLEDRVQFLRLNYDEAVAGMLKLSSRLAEANDTIASLQTQRAMLESNNTALAQRLLEIELGAELLDLPIPFSVVDPAPALFPITAPLMLVGQGNLGV